MVLGERYLLWDGRYRGVAPLYDPSFYSFNYIRIALMLVPFLHASCLHAGRFDTKELKHNLPFLFLCLFPIALPSAQLNYLVLFFVLYFFMSKLNMMLITSFVTLFLVLTASFPLSNLLPSFYGPDANSTAVHPVKANMFTFRTVLETYAVNHKGLYPANSLLLQEVAEKNNYWKDFINPVTGKRGYRFSFSDISQSQLLKMRNNGKDPGSGRLKGGAIIIYDIDFIGVRILSITKRGGGLAGQVLYYRESPTHYFLYGSYQEGNKLLFDRGTPFILTNS